MYMVSLLSILPFTAPACGSAQGGGEAPEAPKVYFVRDITPENMVRLYEALERPATGKVACFRMWGNQNTWAYFSASLSYVI